MIIGLARPNLHHKILGEKSHQRQQNNYDSY